MKNRPLGCLTFSALLFAALAALAVGAAMLLTGNSIFSPGGLSARTLSDGGQPVSLGGVTSHAQLETRCDACHAPFWSAELTGDRCLACHTNVAEQTATRTGLHGRLDATAATCRGCHTDHHGAAASATQVDPRLFPHDQTGFALTAHIVPAVSTDVGCRECHVAAPRDYASTDCIGCHQRLDQTKMAAHTDTYGPACLNCHDGKDTYGHSFAHTSYPLTGKHATVATCDSCHHGATTLTALRATPKDCATCHNKDDVHQGRLGTDCASCHTSDGWAGATIDHTAKTSFALTGLHVDVACESCHVNRQWTGLGTTCVSCHQKDDAHQGRLGTDCAACHDTHGWDDASFNHDLTGFPLKAAHATVECGACHQNGQFHGTPTTCAACHDKPASHSSFFSPNCESCHSEAAWQPASFDHSVTPFRLTGAHAIVVCQKCHPNPTVTFTGAQTTCAACHSAPTSHDSHFGSACAECHTTSAWTPATFDHSVTSWNLTGAHELVVCQKCHPNPKVTFSGASSVCAACHAKPASHTAAMATNCGTCHSTRAWTPATFDHAASGFPLSGAHSNLTCARCHTNPNTFGGLSTACASCHPKPASHTAAMSTNCAACHSTGAWTPATFDHAQTQFPLTGAHTNLTCAKCHTNPNTFGGLSKSCAACHTKPSNHTAAMTVCATCHSTRAWTPATFDHDQTQFPLTGAHTGLTCAKCHTNPNTFGGLSTSCASCHTKPANHTAQMATNCGACHGTGAWKPATFDHAASGFPLSGAHSNLTCAKCHTNPNTFGGLSPACVSCHSSPGSHPSFYGTTCTKCHTTSAFTPISYTAAHSFPLTHGGAAKVCTQCHTTSFTTYTCGKCHDPSRIEDHAGRSVNNCASCHPKGRGGDQYPLGQYPLSQHPLGQYPLEAFALSYPLLAPGTQP